MDFFDVVNKRKCVRKFAPGKLKSGNLKKILETVNLAPSAGNLQSYKVFKAESESAKEKINYACFNQKGGFVKNASVILIFCAHTDESASKYGERGKTLYSIQDATIAASFAVLASTALGYSSCWLGSFDTDKMKKALNTDLIPVAVIPVGFANETPQRPERKSLDKIAKKI